MKEQLKTSLGSVRNAFVVTCILLLVCGFGYPLLLTGLAQLAFPHQANGSMVMVDGQAVGSELVGQDFTENHFMKCRPSAVNYNTYTEEQKANGDYAGVSSGSKNYGPSNPELAARVEADMADFLAKHPHVSAQDIPTDLLTASGSGLDPHITPASAAVQLTYLSETTGLSLDDLKKIVANHTEEKVMGIFGEERVNVLGVNIDIAQKMGLLCAQ